MISHSKCETFSWIRLALDISMFKANLIVKHQTNKIMKIINNSLSERVKELSFFKHIKYVANFLFSGRAISMVTDNKLIPQDYLRFIDYDPVYEITKRIYSVFDNLEDAIDYITDKAMQSMPENLKQCHRMINSVADSIATENIIQLLRSVAHSYNLNHMPDSDLLSYLDHLSDITYYAFNGEPFNETPYLDVYQTPLDLVTCIYHKKWFASFKRIDVHKDHFDIEDIDNILADTSRVILFSEEDVDYMTTAYSKLFLRLPLYQWQFLHCQIQL